MIDLRENQETIAKFDLCYKASIDPMTGAARYDRVSLPNDGGMESQPHKLMGQFADLESFALDELREDVREARKKPDDNGGSGTCN